jgi:S-adenosylmethionine synthetase
MDNYQVRFPTNVEDVARVLFDLTRDHNHLSPRSILTKGIGLDRPLPPILHYASPAPSLTKYQMTKIIAKHLELPIDHVIPDSEKPVLKPGQTERPENTQLSTTALKDLGVDVREDETFDNWWGKYVADTK